MRFRPLASMSYDVVWKNWSRLSEGRKGTYPIAHHGIQRSGTNFLLNVLEQANYRVVNKVDPSRKNPKHKHFRWQDDKSGIVMDEKYRNSVHAKNIAEVNALCKYKEGMKHLVIFREPRDWIDGVFRWGAANKWFSSEEEFVEGGLAEKYLREWHSYYSKWQDFMDGSPEDVMILSLTELKSDPNEFIAAVDLFCSVQREGRFNFSSGKGKVKHSRPMSEARSGISSKYLDEISAYSGLFDWRKFSSGVAK